MNHHAIQPCELEAIITLPESLRSEQCYNDIQHSMLVILFRHALKAVRAGNLRYTDMLMDNITIYLYIHFLAEEEGTAFSMSKGIYDRQAVAAHAAKHLRFLDYWTDEIYAPHKSDSLTWTQRYESLEQFYARIIQHIDDDDQNTYGAKLEHDDKNHRSESAFVARSNIPLSPLMAGALETVNILEPRAARLIDVERLAALARAPLADVCLTELDTPLIDSGETSLRDRFYSAKTGLAARRFMTTH